MPAHPDWLAIDTHAKAMGTIINGSTYQGRHVLVQWGQQYAGITIEDEGFTLTALQRQNLNTHAQEIRDIIRDHDEDRAHVVVTVGPIVTYPGQNQQIPGVGETVPGTSIPIHKPTTPPGSDDDEYIYVV